MDGEQKISSLTHTANEALRLLTESGCGNCIHFCMTTASWMPRSYCNKLNWIPEKNIHSHDEHKITFEDERQRQRQDWCEDWEISTVHPEMI